MDLAEHSDFTKIELNPKKSNQKLGETGKPEYSGKNLSQQSREPTNSVHIQQADQEIEPWPYWWKASTFTTAPTLLSNRFAVENIGTFGSISFRY